MLDDRNRTMSSQQYVGEGAWNRGSDIMAWECLLGEQRGGGRVSSYAAPGRASDLTALPKVNIDVGAADFREEDFAYASVLWKCGVQAELDVWPGAFHASDLLAPTAVISVATRGD
ncbi:esterase/lipase [Mollisia scopiformis]|uniref:Esterase/lipase n=1 Tax=Mollisia scopiformis TaxID=149040 RepID=A0A194X4H1_MOLSC|nr:esterase/lipase [Mollisia scopiformis]KUJ15070.1 esterase/lipase [Mollisia scopiformis]